uniref:EF-hand domain-containing protein n=1 Tax=Parastrongyloides trichosuri TaxID=131310 RepID=A0A0N4ZI12_PARTI
MDPYMCERYILDDQQLKDVFHMLDMDRDGFLGRSEIGALLRNSNYESTMKELNFIFEEVDTNDNGKITGTSFLSFMKPPENISITLNQLEDKFDKYANSLKDKDGVITKENMKQIVKELDFQHDEDHLINVFDAADSNKDGFINFHEFILLLRRVRFCC